MSPAPIARRRLTPADLYTLMAGLSVLLFAVFWSHYLAGIDFPFDSADRFYLIGRDFINTWMGARATLAAQSLLPWYDIYTYNAALQETFSPDLRFHMWSYPPHLQMLTWPLGLLAYFPAFLIWSALGIGAYLLAATDGWRKRERVVLLLAAPALFMNILIGQNGFFTAALLIGGLVLLERRPIVAGILFGILTFKPQMGLLLPVMLLVTWRWRAIVSTCVTAASLVALSAWWFGVESWTGYVTEVLAMQARMLNQFYGLFLGMMPTVFMNLRLAGVAPEVAGVVQYGLSAFAVGAVAWTYWRRRDAQLSAALLVTATFLMTPYALVYDMVVFGWVVAIVREHARSTALDHALALAVWTLPVTSMLLCAVGVPGSALLIVALASRLLWRLHDHAAAHALPTPAGAAHALAQPA